MEAIVISLSDKGKITEYRESQLTHNPKIIKTKKINKEKDLKIIRDKLDNNKKLTLQECALLVTLPLFDIPDSEEDITEEVCYYMENKKDCIPDDLLDEMVIAMYLNILEYILEYILDSKKQNELLEVIKMAEREVRLIETIEKRGEVRGSDNTMRELLNNAFKRHSVEEIAEFLDMGISEVRKYLEI